MTLDLLYQSHFVLLDGFLFSGGQLDSKIKKEIFHYFQETL